MALSTTVFTSSIYIDGSISYGRLYERMKYNAKLLGQPANLVGAHGMSRVVDANPTGTLTIPSWTHASEGFNQAFVGMSLSSSFYEARELNYFFSGTEAVESSPVPATAPLYYSKQSRLQTIIVKKTASFFDTVRPFGVPNTVPIPVLSGTTLPNSSRANGFQAGMGTDCQYSTSSYTTASNGGLANNCSVSSPCCFFLNVPVSGRLVDLKVWVEFVHYSSTVGGGIAAVPLATVGLALQNPNLTWGNAHPILNDSVFQAQFSASNVWTFGPTRFGPSPPLFYQNSFLLWEGSALNPLFDQFGGFSELGVPGWTLADLTLRREPCWDADRGMRVVFSDSGLPNPRRLYNSDVALNFIGSPNASGSIAAGNAFGAAVPWTSDATQPTGSHLGPGSPPSGWLTGPGMVASVNEWPTTGSNYGASSLQGVYPMLDPIYGRKRVTGNQNDSMIASGGLGGIFLQNPSVSTWRGFRPGLRGSEISGTWVLMAANCIDGGTIGPFYFRQARLEITYESEPTTKPTAVRRSYTMRKPLGTDVFRYSISGSDTAGLPLLYPIQLGQFGQFLTTNCSVTDIWTPVPSDAPIGRTFGITYNTGSIGATANWALLYRLSGTLAGISGSVPGWLTNADQSGMPSIPQSSASLAPPASSASLGGSSLLAASVFSPTKVLDGARVLTNVAADLNPPLSLHELAIGFVSASSI